MGHPSVSFSGNKVRIHGVTKTGHTKKQTYQKMDIQKNGRTKKRTYKKTDIQKTGHTKNGHTKKRTYKKGTYKKLDIKLFFSQN